MDCIYLTHSARHALQLQMAVRGDSILIHRSSLPELRAMLHLTGARVIVVDMAFAGGRLLDLLSEILALAPQCSLVVAAPEIYADRWAGVMFSGAFDLILIPFHRHEAAGVLRRANLFAVKNLAEEARNRRVRRVLFLIRRQPGGRAAQ